MKIEVSVRFLLNLRQIENVLKQIERDYKNNPNKIFDLKDYPSLTYADLVNHFGKDEVNLIKG